ncbi:MAG TPA: cold shock domain-containing protein [Roseiarcus sp.]|jgi:cold shock CspA family protein
MQTPVEVAFQHCEPTDEIPGKFGRRLTSCHVVVSRPQARHRTGNLFQVDIRVAMPDHRDVIVDRGRRRAPEHQRVLVAIRDAFDAAVRQIEEAERDLRGEVKTHVPHEEDGRVAKFLAGEDCGFLQTPDGREIYFHRNALHGGAFDRLTVGSEVRFVEAIGDNGPQAISVRLVRHHLA